MTDSAISGNQSRSISHWDESSKQETNDRRNYADDNVTIRHMSVEDCELQRPFFNGLSGASRLARFMGPMAEISSRLMRVLSDIHPQRHVVFLAAVIINGQEVMVGEARYVVDTSDSHTAEFAISIADDWQGQGLAVQLLSAVEEAAFNRGIQRLVGVTLHNNIAMKKLGQRAGYRSTADANDARAVRLIKTISKPATLH